MDDRPQSIRDFDLVISGFTQRRWQATGADMLWLRMRRHSSPRRCVARMEWNEDWKRVAKWIERVGEREASIRVYCYSWGCGWGTTQLAHYLHKHQLTIDHVVSADGVYRSRLLPAWMPANIVSITSVPEIEMPANVRRVEWSYQRVDPFWRPRGHTIIAADEGATLIEEGVEREFPHVEMDSDPWWHRRSLEVARAAAVEV